MSLGRSRKVIWFALCVLCGLTFKSCCGFLFMHVSEQFCFYSEAKPDRRSHTMLKDKPIDISQTNMALFGSDVEKEIKKHAAETEAAWKGIGQAEGLKIW